MTAGQLNAILLAMRSIATRFTDLGRLLVRNARLEVAKAELEECEYLLAYHQSLEDKSGVTKLQSDRDMLRLRVRDLGGVL